MRILWVTPQLPCRRSGGQTRQYYLLRWLAQRHEVQVLTLVRDDEQEAAHDLRDLPLIATEVAYAMPKPRTKWGNRRQMWQQRLFSAEPHYASIFPIEALRQPLRDLLSRWTPDVVHIEHLFGAPLSAELGHIPWVLGEQNVETSNIGRQLKLATNRMATVTGTLETRKLRQWEERWVAASNATVVVSEPDRLELQQWLPNAALAVVPNGVDTASFAPPTTATRHDLLFFGTLDYLPNVEGVSWFIAHVLPLILAERPHTTLHIVGGGQRERVAELAKHPAVELVGFVDDIRPRLWQAAVCVVPLFSGGGTRLKIVEALAAECPVVTTTIGAEGLQLSNGNDVVIADEPSPFAQAVVELLQDDQWQRTLSAQGQATVESQYDWRAIGPQLEAVYAEVVR